LKIVLLGRRGTKAALKVAHPLMLQAIAAAKKKDDRIDARKIFDWWEVAGGLSANLK
jgi:hypothetical protein